MSEINLKQAAEEVRSLTRTFRSLQRVGEFLDDVGSLEQVRREAETAKDKAQAEAADAIKEAEAAKALMTDAKSKVAEARAEAKRIREAADQKAADIVNDAKAQAEAIVTAGEDELVRVVARKTAEEKLALELAEANNLLLKEGQELEKKIEKLKAQAAKILGQG